jgi:hypothetical protein
MTNDNISEGIRTASDKTSGASLRNNRLLNKSLLKSIPDNDFNFINDETKKLNLNNSYFNNNPKLPKISNETPGVTLKEIQDTLESVKTSNKKHNLKLDNINSKIQDYENTVNEDNQSERTLKKEEINELITQYNNENQRQEKNIAEIIPTIKPSEESFQNINKLLQDEKLNTKMGIDDIQKIQNKISQKLNKSSLDDNQFKSSKNLPASPSLNSQVSELNHKPLIDEILLNNILKALKSIFILILIIVAFGFLVKYFTKTPIDKLKKVDEAKELIATFKAEIIALKNTELSPRDEIIKYYEIFYLFIKGRHYPETEAPPPTELFHQIESFYSPLNNQLETVTDIFCQTVYGKHEVHEQKLMNFRNSIEVIFKRIIR